MRSTPRPERNVILLINPFHATPEVCGKSRLNARVRICTTSYFCPAESQFRTMKYPDSPDLFGCIDSRAFCQQFFQWYNEEHAIPKSRCSSGGARRCYQAHPDRFVRRPPKNHAVDLGNLDQ